MSEWSYLILFFSANRHCHLIISIVVSDSELDVSNARLSEEINDLKSELTKYKEEIQKGMKYKEMIEDLIKNGVINEKGEEKINF